MKELPKVFANKIDKDINNTQDIFYGSISKFNNIRNSNKQDIIRKINNIFKSSNHVYKSLVKISYENRVEEKVIVGRTNNYLITINKEYIKISDILDIEKI